MPRAPRVVRMLLPSAMCGWCAQSFRPWYRGHVVCSPACRRGFEAQRKRLWSATHPEEVKARKHAYYFKHKAEHNQKIRANYLANREHYLEYARLRQHTHAEQLRQQHAAYYQKNRFKIAAQQRQYAQAHKESTAAAKRLWDCKNREKSRIRAKRYRAEHTREVYARIRDWGKRHPLSLQAYRLQRRARVKTAVVNDVTPSELKALIRASGNRCAYCHKHIKKPTVDHITPLAKGGAHTLQNLIVACLSCNSQKHIKEPLSPVQPWLLII